MADDVVRHYGRSTAAVAFVVPPRAAAMNVILGIAALMDVMRKHVNHKSQFLDGQLHMYGVAHRDKCEQSPFWKHFQKTTPLKQGQKKTFMSYFSIVYGERLRLMMIPSWTSFRLKHK